MKQIVIIGNGIAGITAARHIRKHSDHKILVISKESEYFFSRTALMYVFMGHMKFEHTKPYEDWFWKKNKIELLQDQVLEINTSQKTLKMLNGTAVLFDTLIIATGSKPSFYNWPGQELEGVQGLYSKQDLALLEKNAPNPTICKKAVVVGGGLIGVELAEMLHSRHIPVTFLVRENHFWDGVLPIANAKLIDQHLSRQAIDVRYQTSLKEIIGENGTLSAVITDKGETIPCNVLGVTTGVQPNIELVNGSEIKTDRGVLVNKYLETNIADIYAIGDCAQQQEPTGLRKPIEAVWYTGRIMGETVAQTICGNKTAYQPGHWFNAAKFFEIEYQTYGWVHAERRKPAYESHFHWQHKREEIALTIAYHTETKKLLGVNSFGMRLRHAVLDRWLSEEQSVEYFLEHFASALFDPEFYTSYHKDILNHYNTAFATNLKARKKSFMQIFNLKRKKS